MDDSPVIAETDFSLNFPRAWGEPLISARLKTTPEDFYVEEQLGKELTGEGEHLYLLVEKINHNTQYVAELIAQIVGVNKKAVSYAGMKDRRARTRQWFSIHLPKKLSEQREIVFPEFKDIKILEQKRHAQKIRRGDHQANFFKITLRELSGDTSTLEKKIKKIKEYGAPNYFGEQRFGHQTSNLTGVKDFLLSAKGKQRSFHNRLKVSAMRSWLFNQVLSERVRAGNWNIAMEGEPKEKEPEELPSAPLWGRGRLSSSGDLLTLEQRVLEPYQPWCDFLEHCGLQQERRALVLKPLFNSQFKGQDFECEQKDDTLRLAFSLPTGTYATVLLREIAQLTLSEQDKK